MGEIDWEQRRYEIAKDVLGSMREPPEQAAQDAVMFADALIKELKKEKEE